jgi:hypothetical protein
MPTDRKEWRLRLEIGTSFRRRGQRYTITGFGPHTCRDGRMIELVELESHCWDCARPFELMASRRNVTHGHLTRRCPRCAQRGVPVAKRPPAAASSASVQAVAAALANLPPGTWHCVSCLLAHMGVGEADTVAWLSLESLGARIREARHVRDAPRHSRSSPTQGAAPSSLLAASDGHQAGPGGGVFCAHRCLLDGAQRAPRGHGAAGVRVRGCVQRAVSEPVASGHAGARSRAAVG